MRQVGEVGREVDLVAFWHGTDLLTHGAVALSQAIHGGVDAREGVSPLGRRRIRREHQVELKRLHVRIAPERRIFGERGGRGPAGGGARDRPCVGRCPVAQLIVMSPTPGTVLSSEARGG